MNAVFSERTKTTLTDVRVFVTPKDPNDRSDTSPREAFWSMIGSRGEADAYEERLKRDFGNLLTRKVLGAAAERSERSLRERLFQKQGFQFTVTDIRYHSLEFGLAISGLANVVDILGKNHELFNALLATLIPETFERVVRVSGGATAFV